MSSNNYTYPDLSEALYHANSIDDARQIYIAMLRGTGDLYHAQYAAKLEQCKKMLSPANLRQLEKDFSAYKDHMRSWSKRTGVNLTLVKRQKDFLGVNAKIRLYIATDKNLSLIKDLLGFRLVLQTPCPDEEISINHCYDVLNETIKFFSLQRDSMLLEAEPRSGTPITEIEAQNMGLIIPENGLILKGFENNVKDYIHYPKKNGYQALHLFIQNKYGVVFEVQIRTAAMDILAEHGSGEHSSYKSNKYDITDLGNIDFSKVHMPGFLYLKDGIIYDKIGLRKSFDPFDFLL